MEQLTRNFLVSLAGLSLETYVSRHPVSSYLEKKRGVEGESKNIYIYIHLCLILGEVC